MKQHTSFFSRTAVVCFVSIVAPSWGSAQVSTFSASYEAGHASESGRSVMSLEGVVVFREAPVGVGVELAPESQRFTRLSGGDFFRKAEPLSVSVTLDEDGKHWTYTGVGENPGGYSLLLDLLLPHRKWSVSGPLWILEASAASGRYSAVQPHVENESFQIKESDLDMWLFVREGERMVSIRFTSSSPVQPLVSQFMAEPDTDIAGVLRTSTARFLNVARITLVPK